jgi:hypothetical protein
MHSGKIVLTQFAADDPVISAIGRFIYGIGRQAISIINIKKMGNHKSGLSG